MTSNSTKSSSLQSEAETAEHLLDDWFDPIEAGLRDRVREFIQAMIESELEAALVRPRYGRRPKADPENTDGPSAISGYRHGHRSRSLIGTFGRVEITVPRARLDTAEGKTTEWKSSALRAYQRRTTQADFADCRRLSCRDQYASGGPGALGRLRWRVQQGFGEPGV